MQINMTREWDETRIDIIGQNGNTGCHYEETYQDKVKRMTQSTTTSLVISDLKKREEMGLKKYGEYVHQSKDDMLQHLYEELLDASLYIKTEIERRKKQ